jgi:hypothetical protein
VQSTLQLVKQREAKGAERAEKLIEYGQLTRSEAEAAAREGVVADLRFFSISNVDIAENWQTRYDPAIVRLATLSGRDLTNVRNHAFEHAIHQLHDVQEGSDGESRLKQRRSDLATLKAAVERHQLDRGDLGRGIHAALLKHLRTSGFTRWAEELSDAQLPGYVATADERAAALGEYVERFFTNSIGARIDTVKDAKLYEKDFLPGRLRELAFSAAYFSARSANPDNSVGAEAKRLFPDLDWTRFARFRPQLMSNGVDLRAAAKRELEDESKETKALVHLFLDQQGIRIENNSATHQFDDHFWNYSAENFMERQLGEALTYLSTKELPKDELWHTTIKEIARSLQIELPGSVPPKIPPIAIVNALSVLLRLSIIGKQASPPPPAKD